MEGERRTKSKFSALVFSTLLKVSETFTVDLALELQREVVCALFGLLYFVFLIAAPIPYVQCIGGHFNLRSNAVLFDDAKIGEKFFLLLLPNVVFKIPKVAHTCTCTCSLHLFCLDILVV